MPSDDCRTEAAGSMLKRYLKQPHPELGVYLAKKLVTPLALKLALNHCDVSITSESDKFTIATTFFLRLNKIVWCKHKRMKQVARMFTPPQNTASLATKLQFLHFWTSLLARGRKFAHFQKQEWSIAATLISIYLPCIQLFDDTVLLRIKPELARACRLRGDTWDQTAWGCFAKYLPQPLLKDTDFWITSGCKIRDSGLSLQLLLQSSNLQASLEQNVVEAFLQADRMCCLPAKYARHKDIALRLGYCVLDQLDSQLQKDRDVLKTCASAGADFYSTAVGNSYRNDLELACIAALNIACSCDDIMDEVHEEIQGDPGFQRCRVQGMFYSIFYSYEDIKRRIPAVLLSSPPFALTVVAIQGELLQIFSSELRGRYDLVLEAASHHPSNLVYASEAVWRVRRDEAFMKFFEKLILEAGCSRCDFPVEVWDSVWQQDYAPQLAASVLLRRRDIWLDLPNSVQEEFRVCQSSSCCVCYSLPQEMYLCPSGCCNYVCMHCSEQIMRTAGMRPPRCPVCRRAQLHSSPENLFGIKNELIEKLVISELESIAGEEAAAPYAKKRKIAH